MATRLRTAEILKLQKLCQRTFPERLNQRVSQFAQRIDERHRTMVLRLSWREGRQTRVSSLQIRRYTVPWTWWRLEDTDKAQREWEMLRWLYGLGWPVPHPGACGEDYVLLDSTGRGTTNWGQKEIQDIARLLGRLHQATPPANVQTVLPVVEVPQELARLEQIAQQMQDVGLRETIGEIAGLLGGPNVDAELFEEGYPLCVLCGESFAHAQIDAQGVTLNNWDQSAWADPRWDVARAVNWLHAHQSPTLAQQFVTAYQAESGRSVHDLDAWCVLAALQGWALSRWAEQHTDTALDAKTQDIYRQVASERETWVELAWRPLTRLRSKQGE